MQLCIHRMILFKRGLPHSDIHGSKPARGSPWLCAACHVLHRLLVPRHPPNALLSFNLLLVSLEESRSIQTSRLRAPSSKGSSHRFEHTLNHRKLERDLQLTHHAQEPFIGFLHRNPLQKSPLGTAISESSTQRCSPTNFIQCR